ncbi:DnaJ family domain-containing protein [Histidinibacterium aquaticum]|uniref:DUF1992 domain-containing protein n=1 Tax=Histidinibacterium aquaticum TaxID=2613962 RepID=A0A5J5GKI1_9RHOB|nr:DUF1992 domain-containing protein [Histidinibacterium aquaticum]KAA9008054.1 DUF1992 domain-containing protein [Histidinibacterium aquaticum]
MSFLSRIAERLIDAAQKNGDLSGLKGEGAPVAVKGGNPHVDVVTEVGHRVMAENGAVPPEVVMRRQLAEARADFRAAETEDEKKRAMLRIADLELRYNMATEARMRRR